MATTPKSDGDKRRMTISKESQEKIWLTQSPIAFHARLPTSERSLVAADGTAAGVLSTASVPNLDEVISWGSKTQVLAAATPLPPESIRFILMEYRGCAKSKIRLLYHADRVQVVA